MTREIKFRAWDKENKGFVIEPFFVRPSYFQDQAVLVKRGNVLEEIPSCELMQYINLKDKNGKEIYEGDIVKVWDNNRSCEECDLIDEDQKNMHTEECENYLCTQEIKWACGYFCDEDTGDYCPPLENEEIEMEVIGNIYENKELLK